MGNRDRQLLAPDTGRGACRWGVSEGEAVLLPNRVAYAVCAPFQIFLILLFFFFGCRATGNGPDAA